ncbi:hypothetical protein CANCADRAFT_99540 [Tortispora caseinolytica NRRL Y-17796]|uniref:Major facilitator superfamily (MFS) profile domain-containing protein n=1 Tax=Tortispora caseinolytica NRRL Y-17796 TaxID=767744 RepID=A0A1E4TE36_9ASCO|nr:hypothetical protein CANCADRAFT_99540 [Tortispora caseinolytica NRRL Y-17796]
MTDVKEPDEFLVTRDQLDFSERPLNKSNVRKWIMTVIIIVISTNLTVLSSIYAAAIDDISKEFQVSHEVSTLGITTYLLGLATGPSLLGPISEFYGRRLVYLVSLFLYIALQFPTAFAPTIEAVLIPRYFAGFCGSAVFSVAGGTISDIFPRSSIQAPMILYAAGPFLGPALGPIIGFFISELSSWRWIFYVCIIWSAVNYVFVVFFLDETYEHYLLRKKAQELRKTTGDSRYYALIERQANSVLQTIIVSLKRPFIILSTDVMILLLSIYAALLLSIVYLYFVSLPIVYTGVYKFREQFLGLAFIPQIIGIVVGTCFGFAYFQYEDRHRTKDMIEEDVLILPMAGGIITVIGLYLFAFTIRESVHWIVSMIGSGLVVLGILFSFNGIFTYTVAACKSWAASGLAANTICRCTLAGVFPLFGAQMYDNLGYMWASLLIAALATIFVPIPFIFYRYGATFREKSAHRYS